MFPPVLVPVSAVGHSHGDVPQQALEEQAAGDSFPPLCPFWTGVAVVPLATAKDKEACINWVATSPFIEADKWMFNGAVIVLQYTSGGELESEAASCMCIQEEDLYDEAAVRNYRLSQIEVLW